MVRNPPAKLSPVFRVFDKMAKSDIFAIYNDTQLNKSDFGATFSIATAYKYITAGNGASEFGENIKIYNQDDTT